MFSNRTVLPLWSNNINSLLGIPSFFCCASLKFDLTMPKTENTDHLSPENILGNTPLLKIIASAFLQPKITENNPCYAIA
jgi:hypothetical protein